MVTNNKISHFLDLARGSGVLKKLSILMDIQHILSEEFRSLLSSDCQTPDFWIPKPTPNESWERRETFRVADAMMRLSCPTNRLPVSMNCLLKRLSKIIKRTGDEYMLRRHGYDTVVTKKQRLFIRQDAFDLRLSDRWSYGSKLVLLNLPPGVTEEHIVPVLERFGTLVSVRLPLNPRTERNRGHAFVTFSRLEEAAAAALAFRDCSPYRGLITSPSCRLFVRQIPRNKDLRDVHKLFEQMLPGLRKVTMFPTSTHSHRKQQMDVKNMGYAFLEFHNTNYAKLGKTILAIIKVFGSQLAVDWADPKRPEYHIDDRNPVVDGGPHIITCREIK